MIPGPIDVGLFILSQPTHIYAFQLAALLIAWPVADTAAQREV